MISAVFDTLQCPNF